MSIAALYNIFKPNTQAKKLIAKPQNTGSIVTQVQRSSSTTTNESPMKSLISIGKSVPTLVNQIFSRKSQQEEKFQGPYLLAKQSEEHRGRKTLVLDLDETLAHSSFEPVRNSDMNLSVDIKGNTYNFSVMVRPGTEEFLEKACEMFEVVIYTASLMEYAQVLMPRLHKAGLKYTILAREHCTYHEGVYVKDLARLGRDLKNVILVDNSPKAFKFNPENAYHIKDFFDDKKDTELYTLLSYFENFSEVQDVRPINSHRAVFEKKVSVAKTQVTVSTERVGEAEVLSIIKKIVAKKNQQEVSTKTELDQELEGAETESTNDSVESGEARDIEERGFYSMEIDVRAC